MTPVDQTRFYDKDHGLRGNCLQAALASVLDYPLAAVPNFVEHDHSQWQENLYQWLFWLGLDIECTYVGVLNADSPPPAGHSIVNGKSVRGIRHSCVAFDGEVVFDPHPSRAGLVSIDSYWKIVPTARERGPLR